MEWETTTYTSNKESNGGKKIRVYDTLYNQDLTHRSFRINKRSDSLYRYNRACTNYDCYLPLIIPGYNPDDGVIVGLGLLYRKQKWGKTPYGWQQRLTVTYATQTGALVLHIRGPGSRLSEVCDFDMESYFKGPRYVLNYYGLGNNTELDSATKSYFRVKSRIFYFSPGISRSWKYSWVRAGLQVQTVNILENQNKFVTSPQSDVDPAIFSNRTYGGANIEWFISSVSSTRFPQNGIYFNPGVSYLHSFHAIPITLSNCTVRLHSILTVGKILTLAHRTGAETNIGDFEFYQAATLGGNENLRGYWRSRFAGESSFYQNTELRLKVARLKGYVLRGLVGLMGFL